jgi:hypothetical protein
MNLFSPRLPHVLSPADLARALVETYTDAISVDDDEALDRLTRALERPELLSGFYQAISAALARALGPRSTPDALMDRLRKGAQRRVSAAPDHPAIAAVLVWINLEAGEAPEKMREALQTDKGRRMLEDGQARLAAHLVTELLK